MSSILDALRKLEEEKAQHPGAPATPRPIEPPAREPAARRHRSRRPARSARRRQGPIPKLWLAVPVFLFALGIIWAATTQTPASDANIDSRELIAAASVDLGEISDAPDRDTTLDRIEADLLLAAQETVRETPGTVAVASLAAPIQAADPEPQPQPETVKPDPPAPDPTPVIPEVTAPPVRTDPEPEIATERMAPIQIDVSPVPMDAEPVPEELPVVKPPIEITPEPIESPQAEPQRIEQFPEVTEETLAPIRTEPSERYQKAMAVSDAIRNGTVIEEKPKPKVEEDIRRYDIMTRTVMAKYDIPEMSINMLSLPNERRPRASALINYNKVYVGEIIEGTRGRVHLIGVEIRGIAVEVEGQRFYYPK